MNAELATGRLVQPAVQHWDVIVIGGGITGAGILREAARCGLKALLLEQRDFAWGTSSRSSKMVHGGLRYIQQGRLGLTLESVKERERLLNEAPGLVTPNSFAMPHHKGGFPGPWIFGSLLTFYDMMAGKWDHQFQEKATVDQKIIPGLNPEGLKGATLFGDAIVDDARLVLRVLDEAEDDGGVALNYCRVDALLKENGHVSGVRVTDKTTDEQAELTARVVINATGAWTDTLRTQAGAKPVVRPLRGSHLVFPAWRLPTAQACCFMHPDDGRPVFLFPWEGCSVMGTTDLDHEQSLDEEPVITDPEIEYLLKAVNTEFPGAAVTRKDVISTWAGVRPVLSSGKNVAPSKETREHAILDDNGLVSVCGGKLTTFRIIACQTLSKAARYLPGKVVPASDEEQLFAPVDGDTFHPRFEELEIEQQQRLKGRYGAKLHEMLSHACPEDFQCVENSGFFWLEVRWAATSEKVFHLDDLLLRRTRLGNVLPEGGQALFPRIRTIMINDAGWSEQRWTQECRRYCDIWQESYSLRK